MSEYDGEVIDEDWNDGEVARPSRKGMGGTKPGQYGARTEAHPRKARVNPRLWAIEPTKVEAYKRYSKENGIPESEVLEKIAARRNEMNAHSLRQQANFREKKPFDEIPQKEDLYPVTRETRAQKRAREAAEGEAAALARKEQQQKK